MLFISKADEASLINHYTDKSKIFERERYTEPR